MKKDGEDGEKTKKKSGMKDINAITVPNVFNKSVGKPKKQGINQKYLNK